MVRGVFDEFPALQVIIGHMGEALPFMVGRATDAVAEVGLPRLLTDYVRDNLYFTTSGFVTAADRHKIAHENAERLLKLAL